MFRHTLSLIGIVSLTLASLACAEAATKPTKYTYKTIDMPFPDAAGTTIYAQNKHKIKVGTYENSFGLVSFKGSNGKYTMHPLMAIQAINASGAMAGWYYPYSPNPETITSGFIHTGQLMIHVHLPGMRNCRVEGMNDQGYVVGTCDDTTGYHAFQQRPDGSWELLDYPYTESGIPANSQANGISRDTEIVGRYEGGHGFFYNGDHWALDVAGATDTNPRSINSHGIIAGGYCVGGDCAGFRVNIRHENPWTTFQRIMVPGSVYTIVHHITDSGELVGMYRTPDNVQHGFVAIPTKGGGAALATEEVAQR